MPVGVCGGGLLPDTGGECNWFFVILMESCYYFWAVGDFFRI